MRRFWKATGYGAVGLLVVLGGVAIAARRSDGPIGPFPGGPLVAGPIVEQHDIDWGFVTPIGQIEFQQPQVALTAPQISFLGTVGILMAHDGTGLLKGQPQSLDCRGYLFVNAVVKTDLRMPRE